MFLFMGMVLNFVLAGFAITQICTWQVLLSGDL